MTQKLLARHSELLAARPPDAGEVAKGLTARIARLEAVLSDELTDLFGGDRPAISSGTLDKSTAAKLTKDTETGAANFRFADTGGREVLAFIDHASALAVTDKVFGGAGDWAKDKPEKLPESANITLRRVAHALGSALGAMFDQSQPMPLAASGEMPSKLIPVKDSELFLCCRVTVALGDEKASTVLVVWRLGHASNLLDEHRAAVQSSPDATFTRGPATQPFAKIPLPLTAVLAQMNVPVSRLSNLQPGDTLQLSLNRSITLRLAEAEIARGEAGEVDGSLALKLTAIAWNTPLKGIQ